MMMTTNNDDDEIEPFNRHGVAVRGVGDERILILAWRAEMSKREALNLAAWLVVLAEEHDGEFARHLEAVRHT